MDTASGVRFDGSGEWSRNADLHGRRGSLALGYDTQKPLKRVYEQNPKLVKTWLQQEGVSGSSKACRASKSRNRLGGWIRRAFRCPSQSRLCARWKNTRNLTEHATRTSQYIASIDNQGTARFCSTLKIWPPRYSWFSSNDWLPSALINWCGLLIAIRFIVRKRYSSG